MALRKWFMEIRDDRADQRRHVRVKALNLIRIAKGAGPRDGVLLNISDLSECGVGFRTQLKMDRDRSYPVALHTPDRDIEASVRVRWMEWIGGAEKVYEVGAEFESVSTEDLAYLREWIGRSPARRSR